jgi:hypothetical protein
VLVSDFLGKRLSRTSWGILDQGRERGGNAKGQEGVKRFTLETGCREERQDLGFYEGEFDGNVGISFLLPNFVLMSLYFPRFNNPDKDVVTHAVVHHALWDYLFAINDTTVVPSEDSDDREKMRTPMLQ